MSKSANSPSPETQTEALQIARATQKPGQTKEQTKLIAQGIQKGIELYKKQQKAKARERDKFRKKQLKEKAASVNHGHTPQDDAEPQVIIKHSLLPWLLLAVSWCGFLAWQFFS
ncbi:DUF2956 domain-containing protein [Photobacterium galatheae]|uniref:Membrane protein n=1 Tax=Photobacterium galatheae TaxID=1654360 RepID=A0A066RZ76_9GAMM|nr:DUF2956 domain-containing protein [Photobacterium galatheae]KDM93007.1 membrane protein [Photobacterium galatheae]MCM0148465.1 DUF2956 domain-containing protein [Photobacterium galatheae]